MICRYSGMMQRRMSSAGGGALGGHRKGVIQSWEDFDQYPWDKIEGLYFEAYGPDFAALRRNMPEGMLAVGGVGNGVFECVQDLVGYMDPRR